MKLLSRLVTWVLILFALYALAWFGAAWVVRDNFDKIVDRAAQRGVQLSTQAVSVSGFPLNFMVELSGVQATRAADNLSWTAPETLTGGINIFRPFTGKIELSGVHQLVSNGLPITANVDAQTLEATINPLSRSLQGFDVSVPAVELTSPGVGAVRLTDVIGNLAPAEDSQVPFRFSVAKVDLPQPFASIANPSQIEIRGHVFPQLPTGLDQQAIGKWQRENGLITLTQLSGASDELRWNGEGALSISPQLQPNADVTMRIKGMDPFMDKLVQMGVINQNRVSLAKIGLALFTRLAEDGEGTEVVAPLVIRNGNVLFGPIELATLPRVNWPQ